MRDETVLVSRVGQDDPSAIWCRVLVSTLGDLYFLVRVAEVLDVAILLRLNVIPCFIAATNISILTLCPNTTQYLKKKERRFHLFSILSYTGGPGL